jgi:hypothetical protein
MPTKRYKPEQIVTLLRQVEVVIVNGKPTPASWTLVLLFEGRCGGIGRLMS